jgi:hypothetical protein
MNYKDSNYGDTKERLERVYLEKHTPVVGNLTLNNGPEHYTELHRKAMIATAAELFNTIPGCTFAFTQMDEIILLISERSGDSWLSYDIQKMCSLAATMATDRFRSEPSNGERREYFQASFSNMPISECLEYLTWRQERCLHRMVELVDAGEKPVFSINGSCVYLEGYDEETFTLLDDKPPAFSNNPEFIKRHMIGF